MIKQPEDMVRGLPNCGVVALSVATEFSYGYVWKALSVNKGNAWKGRMYLIDMIDFLVRTGVGFKAEELKTKRVLYRWVDENTRPNQTYIVRVGGHYVTVRNGRVVDQHEESDIEDYSWKNKRVTDVIRIKN